MYSYKVRGKTYDTIVVDMFYDEFDIETTQYHMSHGEVVFITKVLFEVSLVGREVYLDRIETDTTDTVILPKKAIDYVRPNAVENTKFRRLVVPSDMKIVFLSKSLYGSESLKEFVSLSKYVRFESDVFPETISVRRL